VAEREGSIAADAKPVKPGRGDGPRIVFLHFTAPPIVGGVEAVIAEHVRWFKESGFESLVLAGRVAAGAVGTSPGAERIPEMDSENPEYLRLLPELKEGDMPEAFRDLQTKIETRLRQILRPDDVVIAHNILTTHFNLALTASVHALAASGDISHLIVWCHDISRHVNPERDAPQYDGQPWDLLRTRIPGAMYVAVSSTRQRTLAGILNCTPGSIEVIPNGVDVTQLLGLSDLGRHLFAEFDLLSADLILLMPVRITKAKNIDFAVHVVEELKASGQITRLLITGPPDPHVPDISEYLAALLGMRETLDLRREVIFLYQGTSHYPNPLELGPEHVGELYRICDLVLMPSIREGFGMPVLEAGMVDRPVFATSIPVTQDLPEFRYFIERDETPYSVARRIREWAEGDAAHRVRREVRGNFTWSRIFQRKILPMVQRSIEAHAGTRP